MVEQATSPVWILSREQGAYSDFYTDIIGVFSTLEIAITWSIPDYVTHRGRFHFGQWEENKERPGTYIARRSPTSGSFWDCPQYLLVPFTLDAPDA